MGSLYKTRRVDSCLPVYNAIQNNTMKNWFDLIPRNLMFLHWVDRVPEPLNQVEIGVVKMATIRFTIGCQIISLMLCGRRKILVVFSGSLSSCLLVSQEELKKIKTLMGAFLWNTIFLPVLERFLVVKFWRTLYFEARSLFWCRHVRKNLNLTSSPRAQFVVAVSALAGVASSARWSSFLWCNCFVSVNKKPDYPPESLAQVMVLWKLGAYKHGFNWVMSPLLFIITIASCNHIT